MQLAHINLDQLSVSALNMRHSKTPPDVSDMVPSIRAKGIRVPLLVRPEGGPERYGIIAGRRRYYAARTVQEEGGGPIQVPCGILDEGEDASAIEDSLLENSFRVDPDEMTAYETYTKMVKGGRSVEQIATTFGTEPKKVERRLAIGNLLPRIRDAYRDERIDVDTLRALTSATKRQQGEWLKMLDAEDENTPFGSEIKHWLCGGQAVPTKLALFPVEQYKGAILGDLFEDDTSFADAEAFWELQNQAVAAKRDEYAAAGWADVVILEPGHTFHTWEYEKVGKRKGGKVFIQVADSGQVVFHEGYLTRKEVKRLAKADAKDASNGDGAAVRVASEVSTPLKTYLNLHKQIAVRAALLDAPGVALRLVILHAMRGSNLWKVETEQQQSQGRAETERSVKDSLAQKDYQQRRAEVLSLLGLPEGSGLTEARGDHTAPLFARVMALSDAEVAQALNFIMADSLQVGSEYVELTGAHLSVDVSKTWVADDVFFDLLRDKRVINRIVSDMAGKKVANANASETGKVQKRIVEDYLTGQNGRAKIENWVPRWMQFPAKRYLKG